MSVGDSVTAAADARHHDERAHRAREAAASASAAPAPARVPTLAACLCARNSAATIERMLTSVRPHVDEVCIYLAGESTDGTPEILERVAAEPGAPIIVEQGAWNNDYAQARNRAHAMARSEYEMWLDDDEVLEGGEHLPSMLARRPAVLCVLRLDVWTPDGVWCVFRPRIIRADLGARWVSPIHERLDPVALEAAKPAWRIAHPKAVRVIHHPLKAPGRHRHRQLVEETFARTRERRLGIYVAGHLANDDEDAAGAIVVLESMVAEPWPPTDFCHVMDAYALLADCRLRLGDVDGAVAANEAFEEMEREWLRDPFIATTSELLDAFPIADDDHLWTRYADDPRTADPHADARRPVEAIRRGRESTP